MPILKSKNENFFKNWSPEMAYILGFFAADGNLTFNSTGGQYVEFTSIDKDILEKIKLALNSDNKISSRGMAKGKISYRLQIGSKLMAADLIGLGMTIRKSKTLELPKIPIHYLPDFVRGYFDGDGCVSSGSYLRRDRKTNNKILLTRFTSGSKNFLQQLDDVIKFSINVNGKIHFYSGAWRLCYSKVASKKLFDFMYKNVNNNLYLYRKYKVFKNAVVA